jgi:hypothetical protein
MSGHTPGPWVAYRKQGFSNSFIGSPSYDVAEVTHAGGNGEANEKLIAEAPELLAALKELVHYDEGSSEPGSYGYEVLRRCKTVIAKAEGRDE